MRSFTIAMFCCSSIFGNTQQLAMPAFFSNNMVLQRNEHIAVWGRADANASITVEFNHVRTSVNAGIDGKWMVRLPPMDAGGPYELFVYSKDTLRFKNVMLGDVWLASGQSNMTWNIGWGINNREDEIKNANHHLIRFFTVEDNISAKRKDDVKGKWVLSDTSTVKSFSAIAYFFARELSKKYNVAIGIVHSSWGGTNIESWISADMLASIPAFKNVTASLKGDTINYEELHREFSVNYKKRESILRSPLNGIRQKVFSINYDDSKWNEMKVPGYWTETDTAFKGFYGYCWLRKKINLPASAAGKDIKISLGEVNHDNIGYFNGDSLAYLQMPSNVSSYLIPGRLVKAGVNILTLRILGNWGVGGFISEDQQLYLSYNDKGAKKIVPLSGKWKYNQNIEEPTPKWTEYYNIPSLIFNAKIAPLIPYTIKGFIWYQGENNVGREHAYKLLVPALLNDWRIRWGQGYLPFIFGQLSNQYLQDSIPSESKMARLREAQSIALNYPNTAMVVNADIGDAEDIHFKNKQESGKRFAIAAQGVAYNEPIEYQGPLFHAMEIKQNRIVISFTHIGEGLKINGSKMLRGFAIAGADKKFVWADAVIEGNTVVVKNNTILKPIAVRYGWADNPSGNLYNEEGLPAAPFRTDNWEVVKK